MKTIKIFVSILLVFLLASTTLAQIHTFVVMGDNRPNFPVEKQPYIFHKLVDEVIRLKPGAIFHTGDMVLGSGDPDIMKRMYRDFRDVIAKFKKIPFYTIPGNHDLHDKEIYVNEFGSTYFSVDRNNCHFIMLSSEEPGETYRVTGTQYAWLKDDLEKSKSMDHIFVFIHPPLYPKIAHIGSSLDRYPAARDSLASLLKQYDAAMVFAGHTHIYNFSVVDGLPQIITGGSGAPLYASNPIDGGFYHFVYVVVNGKDADYRVVRIEDEIKIANELRRRKKYEQSLTYANKAIEIKPEHPQPYLTAAMAYHYLNDEENVQNMVQRFIDLQGDEEDAMFLLGHSFFNLDRNTEMAEKYYQRILVLNPESEYALMYLGRIKYREKKYNDAITFYKKAIEKTDDPDFKEYMADQIRKAEERLANIQKKGK